MAKVTFLYFSTDDSTRNVVMYSPIFGYTREPFQLSRVENSKIWYRCVELPIDTVATYSFVENDSLLPWPNTVEDEGLLGERLSRHVPDRLNPVRWKPYPDFLPSYEASVLRLRGENPQSSTTPSRPGVVETLTLADRNVWLYRPPHRSGRQPAPRLLILLDGDFYLAELGIIENLDLLHADPSFAPLYVLLVNNPNETRLQELFNNGDFQIKVIPALLHATEQHVRHSFTRANTAIGGLSAGAYAAARMALIHSGKFARVLSQSGSFWWPWNDTAKRCEKSLLNLYREAKTLDLHFSITIGKFECNPQIHMLDVNREFLRLLHDLKQSVCYRETATAHESLGWRETLYDTLVGLFPST